MSLPPLAEEYASAYARIARERKTTRFNANFWADWSAMLPNPGCPIKSLAGCDFSRFVSPRKEVKKKTQQATLPPVAFVDGVPQPVVKYAAEAGGIFLGRGSDHPFAGRIKRRLTPADVTLNIGEGIPVPSPGSGQLWAGIVHDPYVDWLAAWRDPLLGTVKYMRLSPGAAQEQSVDRDKFEQARALHKVLPSIMARNAENMYSNDKELRQLSTCFYVLERLALRVGNPGDTRVRGVTSLLAGHVRPSLEGVRFDFIGKDSVPYKRTVVVESARARANLVALVSGKAADKPVFDRVTSTKLNAYLDTFMKGLTAKDLRTCRASAEFEDTLVRLTRQKLDPRETLLTAGARVAYLCNHRRSPPYDDDLAIQKEIESLRRHPAAVTDLIKRAGLSLNTSRTNYVDPRIALAFCARSGLPESAAFHGKVAAAKFSWAAAELAGSGDFAWTAGKGGLKARHTQ